MTDREKLISLVNQLRIANLISLTDNDTKTLVDNLIGNGAIFIPCKAGTVIGDKVVDEVCYEQSFGFDGELHELREVSLRDKDAKGPIYSAYPMSFEEAEKALAERNTEK